MSQTFQNDENLIRISIGFFNLEKPGHSQMSSSNHCIVWLRKFRTWRKSSGHELGFHLDWRFSSSSKDWPCLLLRIRDRNKTINALKLCNCIILHFEDCYYLYQKSVLKNILMSDQKDIQHILRSNISRGDPLRSSEQPLLSKDTSTGPYRMSYLRMGWISFWSDIRICFSTLFWPRMQLLLFFLSKFNVR